MPTYDVGDYALATLTVVPFDVDTAVAATVTTPAGVTSSATVDAGDVPGAWAVRLLLTTAGEWRIDWAVTGTGALVEHTIIEAASSGTAPLGRVYATTTQLADYTGEALPTGAARLLRRASRRVDDLLRTAVYDVDDDGLPTGTAVAAALAEATCAQVEWWGEIGDDGGNGAVAALAGAQIGSVKLPGGGGGMGGGIPDYAPDAVAILQRAGLTSAGPQIPDAARRSEYRFSL